MFNFWWSAGWLMNLNPICHPSSAKKMKCSFLDYVQLLMISRAGQWTWTPSTTPLQPKNEMLIFGLHSTSDDRQGWSMDSNLIHHPSPGKKMKCSLLDYIQLWWLAGLVNGFKPHPPPVSSQKNEMPIFGFLSISGDQPGWSMDSNPIHHLSPTKKMKCLFLHYVQLLMISQAGQWTQTPSATPLQPKKWNAHFCITFNFWWLAGLVIGLKHHPPALSSQQKWNAHFWITFNFWWSVGLVNGLESHLPPLSK